MLAMDPEDRPRDMKTVRERLAALMPGLRVSISTPPLPPTNYDSFPPTEVKATPRLRAYYARLGFERIGRSMFYGIYPDDVRPGVKELALPDTIQVPADALGNEDDAGHSPPPTLERVLG